MRPILSYVAILCCASWQYLVAIKIDMERGDGSFLELAGLPLSVVIHNQMTKELPGDVQLTRPSGRNPCLI